MRTKRSKGKCVSRRVTGANSRTQKGNTQSPQSSVVPSLFLGKVAEERDDIVGKAAVCTISTLCLKLSSPGKRTKEACVDILETVGLTLASPGKRHRPSFVLLSVCRLANIESVDGCANCCHTYNSSVVLVALQVLNQSQVQLSAVAIECLVNIFRNELNSSTPHTLQRIIERLVTWINRQVSRHFAAIRKGGKLVVL